LGEQEGLTRSIKGLGYVMLFSGDFENALPVLNEALALAQQINHKGLMEAILNDLIMADALQGNNESAIEHLKERLTYYRNQKDEGGIAWALLWLGFCIFITGDYLHADKLFRESLVIYHRFGNHVFVSLCQIGLAGIALERGQPVYAAKLLSASETLRQSVGGYISPRVRQVNKLDLFLSNTREQLGEAAFTEAWEEGKAIASESLDEIVEYSLKDQ
jgi:tetratricopeptide (TPR) repeat protein